MCKSLIAVLLLVCVVTARCQAVIGNQSQSAKANAKYPGAQWHLEKWTANDAPYVAIRRRIESEFLSGSIKSNLTVRYNFYQAKALQNPLDAKAQFAWGCALYNGMKAKLSAMYNTWNVREAMRAVPSPHSYEFARMRYLVENVIRSGDFSNIYEFPKKVVGMQLLLRNPNDYSVKYYQIQLLDFDSPYEKQQGLRYAQDLVRLKPKDSASYAMVGNVYQRYWIRSNLRNGKWMRGKYDQANLDKAFFYFRKALGFEPANSEYHTRLEKAMKSLRAGNPL